MKIITSILIASITLVLFSCTGERNVKQDNKKTTPPKESTDVPKEEPVVEELEPVKE